MPASRSIALTIAIIVLKTQGAPLGAEGFVCAGLSEYGEGIAEAGAAAKVVQLGNEGSRSAVVLFAKFRGEAPGEREVPGWAERIFDPGLPGSFSHFYDTMSFGTLRVRGEIAQGWYEFSSAFWIIC